MITYTKSTLPFTELCYFDGITIVTTSCLLDKFEMSMMTMMILGRSLLTLLNGQGMDRAFDAKAQARQALADGDTRVMDEDAHELISKKFKMPPWIQRAGPSWDLYHYGRGPRTRWTEYRKSNGRRMLKFYARSGFKGVVPLLSYEDHT